MRKRENKILFLLFIDLSSMKIEIFAQMGPCGQDRGAGPRENQRKGKCLSNSAPRQGYYFFVLQSTQKSRLRLIFFLTARLSQNF